MIQRGLLAGAVLALVVAQLGLHWSLRGVEHRTVRIEPGIPATLYLPDSEARPAVPPPAPPGAAASASAAPASSAPPVVILVHGWGTNRGSLRSLGRDLATAGYAALAIDLPGHGANQRPFPAGQDAARALAAEVDAAVLHVRQQPAFDGQRIALLGHGIGADAVLEQASRDPAVAAVIALAPVRTWNGGYTPPNALVLWGERQGSEASRLGRLLAERLASTSQLRLGRTYGAFERGSAVLARGVESEGYLGLLQSRETEDRIRSWLAQSFQPSAASGAGERALEPRVAAPGLRLWSWLALLGAAGLWFAVCAVAPRGAEIERALPPGAAPIWIAALAAGIAFAAGSDPAGSLGPFSFFPFADARVLLGVLAISGAVLMAAQALTGVLAGPSARALLVGSALAVLLYLSLGVWLERSIDPWLGPQRVLWTLLAALLALPHFALTEQWLRQRGVTAWFMPALAKLLLFGLLVAASAAGWLPDQWLLLAPWLAAVLALLELAALRLYQVAASPWLSGWLQALAFAWFLTATFPYAA